jgi:hypothetical protein
MCVCARTCVCVCVCVWGGARVRACACEYVALFVQNVTCMRHIVSFVAPLARLHLPTLSHKRLGFWKNVTEHKICILMFSTTFV